MSDSDVGGDDNRTRGVLRAAQLKSQASLAAAEKLVEANVSAAYVWSVRAIEIFVREVMLLPLYLDEYEGDFAKAWASSKQTFDSGKWKRALLKFEATYGELDPMITDDGSNVWDVWQRHVVPRRGEIVHGRDEASEEETRTLLIWTRMMMQQLSLRLAVTDGHPANEALMELLASIPLPPTDDPPEFRRRGNSK